MADAFGEEDSVQSDAFGALPAGQDAFGIEEPEGFSLRGVGEEVLRAVAAPFTAGMDIARGVDPLARVKEAATSFGEGVMGIPGQVPTTAREVTTKTLPQDVGRLTVGLPQFVQDIGQKLVYEPAKAITDPLILAATGEPGRAVESLKQDIPRVVGGASEGLGPKNHGHRRLSRSAARRC